MSEEIPNFENVTYDASLPAMDREQIDMLLMADDGGETNALAKELFELYETESREKLEGLEEACERADGLALRRIVHFIAGSAGNLGLARLSSFYRNIESAIDAGKFRDFERAAPYIRREFEKSCRLFREEFGI